MSAELDSYFEGSILSEQAILERVDEYALYCYYLGYAPEIGRPIISPIRPPEDPDTVGSFVIFYPTRIHINMEFLWSDNATGQRGNVFNMISLMYGGISISKVYELIDHDFNLGFINGNPICHRIQASTVPKKYIPCSIKIRSRHSTPGDLSYWKDRYGIESTILNRYSTTSVELYWLNEFQRHPKVLARNELCFAYRVWSKYQIYRPFAPKDQKFRNDFTPRHIMGFCQLTYNRDTLIITKANKDVMMFAANYGIETIAARSENTPIPDEALRLFERKYKNIFVWFDNDGKQSADYYPYPAVTTPAGEPKDPSDYYEKYGPEKTMKLITQLTNIR